METVFVTDAGRVRDHNEDTGGIFTNSVGEYLAVVADGMGGHQAGDVASDMVTNYLREAFEPIDKPFTPEQAEEWLRQQINTANKKIYETSLEQDKLAGMGTTVVTAVCTPSFAVIAHVGDSRAYHLSETEFQLKTEDHSLVNELKNNGQLTEEEAENHPRKNVLTRAIGTEEQIKSETMAMEWKVGEGIVLCSDGLTNKISPTEIKKNVKASSSLHECARTLIHTANERGGEDNITLAIILHSPYNKEVE
ncbi:Stp1/IreP family PP2C-type Ser/Thr phosphatase [Salibacterium salarium]|uniref:protein-serine/threonine phosphatase n=1 Tax=Salibacterium salarium TaxID=284579 RepID=A0A428MZ19_9BACI|nr:Stp1/IreP family PP2C-type Ser/Thr phosphatase [Salibacterium salarium]RSL31381.1 Stp1/IreP family PP2C-type Ser/Thr phosphatase [Salibacterium salarium]